MPETPPPRKKLIEVALPLEAINREAAREKSIRHGHPSTLHLWWARRPLAACRAVLFASLVDDPESDPAYKDSPESAYERRAELFNLIEELVKWENSNSPKVINAARAEIAASVASRKIELGDLAEDEVIFGEDEGKTHPDGPMADDGTTAWRVMLRRSTSEAVNHFLAKYAPPVLDPFAGGGSIPLEAQRLGLRANASDLNPVAVLINKALIEIPPHFNGMPPKHPKAENRTNWAGLEGLAEDLRHYGRWLCDKAYARIGKYYATISIDDARIALQPELEPLRGTDAVVTAWVWARTVASPNPAARRQHVPLVRSFWLSKKPTRRAWIEPVIDKSKMSITYRVRTGDGQPPEGTVARNKRRCLFTDQAMPLDYVRAEAQQGRMEHKLLALVCQAGSQRIFMSATDEDEATAKVTRPDDVPSAPLVENARHMTPTIYGMTEQSHLYTDRQALALTTFADLIAEAREHIRATDPSVDQKYIDAITVYLACAVSRCADYWSSLAVWAGDFIGHTFGRNALPMIWDFAEANPFSESTGDWSGAIDWVARVLERLYPGPQGEAIQADAASRDNGVTYIVNTDPPYYDNVPYADLSDYFYIWLRRSLGRVFPDLFATIMVPKADEIVADSMRHNGRDAANNFFESRLSDSFESCRQMQHNDYPLGVYYAFKQAEADDAGVASTGWETMLNAVRSAGFCVCGTWPMRTERPGRLRETGSNALASSILLVCRPRDEAAPLATRREFSERLHAELPDAIRQMQHGSVAPVDLAQASIGPGMGVFTRYTKVVNADGTPMTVREALQLINQVLDEVLAEQEGDFDAVTRFALKWFEQFSLEPGPFGDAEILAKAMAISVQGVVQSGVAESGAGRVRLLKRDELDELWDPQAHDRLTIWEVTQHLIRELEQNGEPAAAELLRRVGAGAGETARELAYRLYQTCERKKWADLARGYNGLVVSWPEIERLSREQRAQPAGAQLELHESE